MNLSEREEYWARALRADARSLAELINPAWHGKIGRAAQQMCETIDVLLAEILGDDDSEETN